MLHGSLEGEGRAHCLVALPSRPPRGDRGGTHAPSPGPRDPAWLVRRCRGRRWGLAVSGDQLGGPLPLPVGGLPLALGSQLGAGQPSGSLHPGRRHTWDFWRKLYVWELCVPVCLWAPPIANLLLPTRSPVRFDGNGVKCSLGSGEAHAEPCAQGCSAREALSRDLWLHLAGLGARGSRADRPSAPSFPAHIGDPRPLSTPDPDSAPQTWRPGGLLTQLLGGATTSPRSSLTWFSQGAPTSGPGPPSRPPPSPWTEALTCPASSSRPAWPHLHACLLLSLPPSSSGASLQGGRLAAPPAYVPLRLWAGQHFPAGLSLPVCL